MDGDRPLHAPKLKELTLPVAETFVSINGEGPFAGHLASFIRLAGCDLDCSYCDTRWARDLARAGKPRRIEELRDFIVRSPAGFVTITGGEPLIHENLPQLVEAVFELPAREGALPAYVMEIETNGAQSIESLAACRRRAQGRSVHRLCFTLDHKLPSSGMDEAMDLDNFRHLEATDSIKFVVGDERDLERMLDVIEEHALIGRCQLFVSCVWGQMDPARVVDFLKERRLSGLRLQLQLHKHIWPPDMRGV